MCVLPLSGMDMALFEAKTAAVELLRHCRFEMVPGQNITYGDKITLDIKSNGKEEFLVHVRDWQQVGSQGAVADSTCSAQWP